MSDNPILDELYAIREKLLAEHGGNLAECLRAVAESAIAANHPVADIPPRPIVRKLPAPIESATEQPSSPSVQR